MNAAAEHHPDPEDEVIAEAETSMGRTLEERNATFCSIQRLLGSIWSGLSREEMRRHRDFRAAGSAPRALVEEHPSRGTRVSPPGDLIEVAVRLAEILEKLRLPFAFRGAMARTTGGPSEPRGKLDLAYVREWANGVLRKRS